MNQTELALFAQSVELIERLCRETERLHYGECPIFCV